jgi:AraC family transcriptional regulator
MARRRRRGWGDDTWEVDDLTVAHHYLAMNVGDEPLRFEVKGARGFRPAVIEPGAVWICPAGESFTHRVAQQSSFALVTLDPHRFATLTAGPRAPRQRSGANYNLRSRGARARRARARGRGGPRGPGRAAARRRTGRGGEPRDWCSWPACARRPRRVARGGLAPAARRRVLELIEARLVTGVSVEELAREAGLSPTHFAKAFKTSLGRPPHQFILARRLERGAPAARGPWGAAQRGRPLGRLRRPGAPDATVQA